MLLFKYKFKYFFNGFQVYLFILNFIQNLQQFTEFLREDNFGSAVSSFGFFGFVWHQGFICASTRGNNVRVGMSDSIKLIAFYLF